MAGKPTGGKLYGSIAHLPGSRLGPGDHHVHPGQAAICVERVRDRRDRVLVQAKLDGSCVGVARLADGRIVALGRAGWPASSSPYLQYRAFAAYVRAREHHFRALLEPGERVAGEWLAQAHGTRYAVVEPFVIFDLLTGAMDRAPYDALEARLARVDFRAAVPRLLHDGGALPVAEALARLEGDDYQHWAYRPLEPQEGVVYRVERDGAADFLAKYVLANKIDGKYLPERSGQPAVWNWGPWEGAR